MKKLLLISFLILFSSLFVASDFETLHSEFVQIRAVQNTELMTNFIGRLESEDLGDIEILTLLADSHREYANWIEDKKDRETHYKKARELAEKAIEMDDSYGMAYYVKGAAIGQLAEMAGIIQSMFLITDFDKSIDKAMELMPDSPFPFIAKGMRDRDTPWPYRNYGKSEERFLKAIENDPAYINSYYELALLYQVWKKKDLAAQYFRKVLELEIQTDFVVQGQESKEKAKKWLEDNGY
ncbi:MAG: tetratricopeptide repeat protein [Kosmotogaceae bacterium]